MILVGFITILATVIGLWVGARWGFRNGVRIGYEAGSARGFVDGQARRTLGTRP